MTFSFWVNLISTSLNLKDADITDQGHSEHSSQELHSSPGQPPALEAMQHSAERIEVYSAALLLSPSIEAN